MDRTTSDSKPYRVHRLAGIFESSGELEGRVSSPFENMSDEHNVEVCLYTIELKTLARDYLKLREDVQDVIDERYYIPLRWIRVPTCESAPLLLRI